jgi:hypothetical protein
MWCNKDEMNELHRGLDASGDLLIVGGATLHERKQGLSDNADCFIALPGGCGTWDELWEVVCERQLKMNPRPVALLNVDGYYDGFLQQMQAAYESGILYLRPEELLPSFEDPADCLNYVVREVSKGMHARVGTVTTVARASAPENPAWHVSLWTRGFMAGTVAGTVMAAAAFATFLSRRGVY